MREQMAACSTYSRNYTTGRLSLFHLATAVSASLDRLYWYCAISSVAEASFHLIVPPWLYLQAVSILEDDTAVAKTLARFIRCIWIINEQTQPPNIPWWLFSTMPHPDMTQDELKIHGYFAAGAAP